MKNNNKGVTIVEILLSIVLISIILILLFSLLSQVNKDNEKNNVQATLLLNQSTFVETVEEDITEFGVKGVTNCSLTDFNQTSAATGENAKTKCIKIYYDANFLKDNIGYLYIYKYYTKYKYIDGAYKGDEESLKWMVSYQRGYYRKYDTEGTELASSWTATKTVMKEITDELTLDENMNPYVYMTGYTGKNNAATIVQPIISSDGQRYDITLGFTYTDTFACYDQDGDEANGELTCTCKGMSICKTTIDDSDEPEETVAGSNKNYDAVIKTYTSSSETLTTLLPNSTGATHCRCSCSTVPEGSGHCAYHVSVGDPIIAWYRIETLYTCNDGDTPSESTSTSHTCTNYSCPDGGTLNGTTCVVD